MEGGGVALSNGKANFEDVVFSDCGATSYGGGLSSSLSEVQGSGVSFESCNASIGGSVYISNGYLSVDSLEITNSRGIVSATRGGGIAVYDSNATLNSMTCDGLIAEYSACIYAQTSWLVVEDGFVLNNFGFSPSNSQASIYMTTGVVKLTKVAFLSNRLNEVNGGQKGAALYAIGSQVKFQEVTFDNHSCLGSGCSVFIDGSDLAMYNTNASNSYASIDGGFMKVTGER